jgi:hypothetical protein
MGTLKDMNVLRDGVQRHREGFGQRSDTHLPLRQALEDGSPGRVRQSQQRFIQAKMRSHFIQLKG